VATIAELAVPHLTSGVPRVADVDVVTSAHPNPVTASTTISFGLASAGHVSVTVFDVEGRAVKTLNNTVLPAGRQHLVWEGDDNHGERVAPGLYFANIEAGGKRSVAKMVVLR
jgi:flagellar hook assembly protein FlgD